MVRAFDELVVFGFFVPKLSKLVSERRWLDFDLDVDDFVAVFTAGARLLDRRPDENKENTDFRGAEVCLGEDELRAFVGVPV